MRRLALVTVQIAITVVIHGACGGEPQTCTSSSECPQTDVCNASGTCEASINPVFLTTSPLPDGIVRTAYSTSLVCRGGTEPYQYILTGGGALPAGLSLDQTGTISGTPTTAGTKNFSVIIQDARNKATTSAFSIVIAPDGTIPVLVIATASIPGATVGAAYTATLAASGGTPAYSWTTSSGALPPGLSLSTSGAISGTPTAAGSFTFVAQVADASPSIQTASLTFTIVVTGSSVPPVSVTTGSVPDGAVGQAYSQTLTATGGTTPYTWLITAGALPPGLSLSASGTISGTPTAGGSFTFAVQVADASLSIQTASATFTIAVTSGPPLAVTTTSLPGGVVGSGYLQTLAATGGTTPYTWSIAAGALPAGLSLSPAGVIFGTPTAAGTSTFTVQVTDSAATPVQATQQLSLTVQPTTLVIVTNSLPNSRVGRSYLASITAGGGTPPYAFTVSGGTLPPGLTLASDGTLSGTPTVSAVYTFTVRATDSGVPAQNATKPFTMDVRR